MKKIFVAFLLFCPSFSFADVRINEIAWMGDDVSSAHEWVELYNDSDVSQNITGWKLIGTDTSDDSKEKFSILLSGDISAKGYFLIESKHSASDKTQYLSSDFTTVSFSLLNSGETLRLIRSDGSKIDEVLSNKAEWKKGRNDPKETMQWYVSGWITSPATPRAENSKIDTSVVPATDTPSDTTDTSTLSTALDTSAHMSPLPLSDFSQKQEVYISAGRNRIVAVGSPVSFEAYAVDREGAKVKDFSSVWSFGDGSQAGGVKVSHTYKYPGDYAVILNASTGGNEAVSRSQVRAFTPKISLGVEGDGAVSLTNESSYEVNLGGWKILGGTALFVISSDTIIESGKKIIFSKDTTGIDFLILESLKVTSPCGIVFSDFTKTIKPEATVATSSTPVEVLVPVIEKKNEPTAFISPAPEKSKLPAVIISQPVKSVSSEKEIASVSQTITLKKPEGFLTKMWNFFFK